MSKYIFVTGGVTSSLGKGIIAASLAKLLQARGYKVTIQKLDPYINIDPGTLNPYEHGECFVTEDGTETDLDLGHYERFLNIVTSKNNNVTTGKIYQNVINNEREGRYLGSTVQVIPHITDEIKNYITSLEQSGNYDIIITELGGTVGDIESLPYIEAVRQLRWEKGHSDNLIIHLTFIPYLSSSSELKTKPTQHSVKTLLAYGIQPDILVCRTEYSLNTDIRKKIALFCNVDKNAVIEAIDANTIYDVPINMQKEKLDIIALEKLKLEVKENPPDLTSWNNFLHQFKNPNKEVTIAFIGKYVELPDAYKSINEALLHAGVKNRCKVNIKYIHSGKITDYDIAQNYLKDIDGILVAPGFGDRDIEGKILSIRFARENNIPFVGICLGMQCSIIEFARNVLGYQDANSTEFNGNTPYPVITLMQDQYNKGQLGASMRLGSYNCKIQEDSLAFKVYGKVSINERHRHRYEFNNIYKQKFEDAGFIASGINTELNLVEIMELKNHRFFIGTQFHPEFKSTVENPHPLFIEYITAVLNYKQN
ncbi:MAG: CTP synthase [Solitalea-like symbiont of Tyrophagus putrescentiae]